MSPSAARHRLLTIMFALTAAMVSAAFPAAAGSSPTPAAVIARAGAFGVEGVEARRLGEAGLLVTGKLDGRPFSIAVPGDWNGDAVVYAHGYTLPGTPTAVAENPSAPDAPMVLQAAFGEGYAAAHSAYDKAGMGVESGAAASLRLRDLLVQIGARHIFAAGFSMGGNIVMTVIEQHPDAFDGAFSGCGVTDGWETQMGPIFDMRAAYNVLTSGTPYALPGIQDVTASALPMSPPADFQGTADQFVQQQSARIAMPILALWSAAVKAPQGPEARIVRQLVAIAGFPEDVASLLYPLVIISLGTDDMRATFGGQFYGNREKAYRPVEMNDAEAAAFNAAVQRFDGDIDALARARRFHQVSGTFRKPLVAVHNRLDPLVAYAQAEALTRHARESGTEKLLLQYALPDVREPLRFGVEGLAHCGFTKPQMAEALGLLRSWVIGGQRPPAPEAR
ncbi:alpha/beta hydrolase family protein [Sphingosinicella sp.]|uniref:alpha/beta hydrolase family protein n=1 Tax=Sphingosinicella sp. TaxID=1917971 RepID=UPI0035AFC8A1